MMTIIQQFFVVLLIFSLNTRITHGCSKTKKISCTDDSTYQKCWYFLIFPVYGAKASCPSGTICDENIGTEPCIPISSTTTPEPTTSIITSTNGNTILASDISNSNSRVDVSRSIDVKSDNNSSTILVIKNYTSSIGSTLNISIESERNVTGTRNANFSETTSDISIFKLENSTKSEEALASATINPINATSTNDESETDNTDSTETDTFTEQINTSAESDTTPIDKNSNDVTTKSDLAKDHSSTSDIITETNDSTTSETADVTSDTTESIETRTEDVGTSPIVEDEYVIDNSNIPEKSGTIITEDDSNESEDIEIDCKVVTETSDNDENVSTSVEEDVEGDFTIEIRYNISGETMVDFGTETETSNLNDSRARDVDSSTIIVVDINVEEISANAHNTTFTETDNKNADVVTKSTNYIFADSTTAHSTGDINELDWNNADSIDENDEGSGNILGDNSTEEIVSKEDDTGPVECSDCSTDITNDDITTEDFIEKNDEDSGDVLEGDNNEKVISNEDNRNPTESNDKNSDATTELTNDIVDDITTEDSGAQIKDSSSGSSNSADENKVESSTARRDINNEDVNTDAPHTSSEETDNAESDSTTTVDGTSNVNDKVSTENDSTTSIEKDESRQSTFLIEDTTENGIDTSAVIKTSEEEDTGSVSTASTETNDDKSAANPDIDGTGSLETKTEIDSSTHLGLTEEDFISDDLSTTDKSSDITIASQANADNGSTTETYSHTFGENISEDSTFPLTNSNNSVDKDNTEFQIINTEASDVAEKETSTTNIPNTTNNGSITKNDEEEHNLDDNSDNSGTGTRPSETSSLSATDNQNDETEGIHSSTAALPNNENTQSNSNSESGTTSITAADESGLNPNSANQNESNPLSTTDNQNKVTEDSPSSTSALPNNQNTQSNSNSESDTTSITAADESGLNPNSTNQNETNSLSTTDNQNEITEDSHSSTAALPSNENAESNSNSDSGTSSTKAAGESSLNPITDVMRNSTTMEILSSNSSSVITTPGLSSTSNLPPKSSTIGSSTSFEVSNYDRRCGPNNFICLNDYVYQNCGWAWWGTIYRKVFRCPHGTVCDRNSVKRCVRITGESNTSTTTSNSLSTTEDYCTSKSFRCINSTAYQPCLNLGYKIIYGNEYKCRNGYVCNENRGRHCTRITTSSTTPTTESNISCGRKSIHCFDETTYQQCRVNRDGTIELRGHKRSCQRGSVCDENIGRHECIRIPDSSKQSESSESDESKELNISCGRKSIHCFDETTYQQCRVNRDGTIELRGHKRSCQRGSVCDENVGRNECIRIPDSNIESDVSCGRKSIHCFDETTYQQCRVNRDGTVELHGHKRSCQRNSICDENVGRYECIRIPDSSKQSGSSDSDGSSDSNELNITCGRKSIHCFDETTYQQCRVNRDGTVELRGHKRSCQRDSVCDENMGRYECIRTPDSNMESNVSCGRKSIHCFDETTYQQCRVNRDGSVELRGHKRTCQRDTVCDENIGRNECIRI